MDWVALFWIMVFAGGFCFVLAFSEIIVDALYDFSPSYRSWADKQMENLHAWDEEVE